jgi:hypothetical protein
MDKISLIKICLFSIFFLLTTNIFGQTADSLQTNSRPVNESDIVEAGESLIKVEIEKPQVQLFSARIQPEFDEVNLEKSFIKEILDKGQDIKIESKEEQRKRIDIEKFVNKNR